MTTPMIELKGVSRTYTTGGEPLTVLKEVNLSIRSGEFVAIMGTSGSGKSTLMNIIGCLDKPTIGSYHVRGVDMASLDGDQLAALRRDTFGFIFQRYNLMSDLNAIENTEVPAVYRGMAKALRMSHASEILTELGLGDRLTHRPNQLSGGQQQRVSIARALMNGGPVILADEPTGALDSQGGKEVMAILMKLNEDGHTIIVVTHDGDIADYAHRIVHIADGCITSDETKKRSKATIERPLEPTGQDKKAVVAVLGESLKMALRSLVNNRMRTALTMLGIIIGVASVVALMAIGNGAIAAHNAGVGGVQKAVQKGGADWKKQLPAETQNYLNSIMAQSKKFAIRGGISKLLMGSNDEREMERNPTGTAYRGGFDRQQDDLDRKKTATDKQLNYEKQQQVQNAKEIGDAMAGSLSLKLDELIRALKERPVSIPAQAPRVSGKNQ